MFQCLCKRRKTNLQMQFLKRGISDMTVSACPGPWQIVTSFIDYLRFSETISDVQCQVQSCSSSEAHSRTSCQ